MSREKREVPLYIERAILALADPRGYDLCAKLVELMPFAVDKAGLRLCSAYESRQGRLMLEATERDRAAKAPS